MGLCRNKWGTDQQGPGYRSLVGTLFGYAEGLSYQNRPELKISLDQLGRRLGTIWQPVRTIGACWGSALEVL